MNLKMQTLAGTLVMFACAVIVDLWYCWPAGADIDAYEFSVYLAVIGTFTVIWYPVLVLAFPRLQRHGWAAGLAAGVLVDLSIALLTALAYWSASSHPEPGSPSSTNAILGLELAYVFAYLLIFLVFTSWRTLLVYAAGGWLAQRLARATRLSPSQP